jgi:hypothetical protein
MGCFKRLLRGFRRDAVAIYLDGADGFKRLLRGFVAQTREPQLVNLAAAHVLSARYAALPRHAISFGWRRA